MTIADVSLVAIGAAGVVLSVVAAITASVRSRLARIEEGVAGLYTRLDHLSSDVARIQGRNDEQDRIRAHKEMT